MTRSWKTGAIVGDSMREWERASGNLSSLSWSAGWTAAQAAVDALDSNATEDDARDAARAAIRATLTKRAERWA